MPEVEKLRCNICGIILTAADAGKHATTSAHTSLKSKLEQDLKKIDRELYKNDSSVIGQWKISV